MKIRHLAPAAALGVALAGVAAPAAASGTYPPAAPEPTQSVVAESAAAVDTTVAGDRLARTGSELAVAGGVGALLVVAGAGAVVVARKRSATQR